MVLVGFLLLGSTSEVGLIAGSMSVGGFLANVGPVLRGHTEEQLRTATVRGGLSGIAAAAFINFLALFL